MLIGFGVRTPKKYTFKSPKSIFSRENLVSVKVLPEVNSVLLKSPSPSVSSAFFTSKLTTNNNNRSNRRTTKFDFLGVGFVYLFIRC